MDGADFKDFKREILKNNKIRREYESLNPKYVAIQALITRRNELSLSQREVARLSGMKQPAICRLESGDNNITVETLFKVANVLNLDIVFKPKPVSKLQPST
jgi:DNA-binding XRE family transcriptional regulator